MKGRRPSPVARRRIMGNPSGRRMPEDVPEPKGEAKKPAEFINATDPLYVKASQLWDEFAPTLSAMGTLTSADGPNFETWCLLLAEQRTSFGTMTTTRLNALHVVGGLLGMDAGSRTRLGAHGNKKTESPGAKYLRKPNQKRA